ncbi:hypothetical protein BEWA_018310 [Theileria equi strain WA]|uniref:Uncharacterized protein n=1 Tax=Theileria equi strain WA TaxID=1537102 RepID=L0AUT2_THEEQ|nr:hypothetical protein BEWA_018310 [Theileria equi strain WA]AFZ78988.1 hypothetical protein BEWA_018310 [Theileria equi strain WA]|eukprot:XP_004828654.1 hypothetical protein BEWA_018310 [Theileria equi strain WA]
MSLLFRLEDTFTTSVFHAISKSSIVSPSVDGQVALSLSNKIYTFKYVNEYFEVTSKLDIDIKSRETSGKNALKPNYIEDTDGKRAFKNLQRSMCSLSTVDSPKLGLLLILCYI